MTFNQKQNSNFARQSKIYIFSNISDGVCAFQWREGKNRLTSKRETRQTTIRSQRGHFHVEQKHVTTQTYLLVWTTKTRDVIYILHTSYTCILIGRDTFQVQTTKIITFDFFFLLSFCFSFTSIHSECVPFNFCAIMTQTIASGKSKRNNKNKMRIIFNRKPANK